MAKKLKAKSKAVDDGAKVQPEALRQGFAACVDEMVRRLDSGYSVIASRHEPPFAASPGLLAAAVGPNAVDPMPRIREVRREMGIVVEVDRVFLIELANAARQRAPSSDRGMSSDARRIAGDDDVDPLVALLQRPGARQRLARLADDLLPVEERVGPAPDPLETSSWLAAADLRIDAKQAIERGAPEHGLPKTPHSTFYRWVANPKNWPRLGIERKDKWNGQPVLVSGLLQLHASRRRGTKLPARASNAGRAGKRRSRS